MLLIAFVALVHLVPRILPDRSRTIRRFGFSQAAHAVETGVATSTAAKKIPTQENNNCLIDSPLLVRNEVIGHTLSDFID